MSGNRKIFCLFLVATVASAALSLVILFSFALGWEAQSRPPVSVDPFYLKMLEKAEKELGRSDYARALKSLEIAAFGLAQDKGLLAKAYTYLGICHYHFKNITKSEEYLRQAAELLGEEEFASIRLLESMQPELDSLLALYNIKLPGKAETIEVSGVANAERAEEKSAKNKENPGVTKKTALETTEGEGKGGQEIKEATKGEARKKAEKGSGKEVSEGEPLSLDRIKEGDTVPLDLVETRPVPVKQVTPIYPSSLRGKEVEGTVIVNALIAETGRVLKTEIIRGIKGAFELDAAAQRAVRQWEFEPATIKGIRVKVWMAIAVEFKK